MNLTSNPSSETDAQEALEQAQEQLREEYITLLKKRIDTAFDGAVYQLNAIHQKYINEQSTQENIPKGVFYTAMIESLTDFIEKTFAIDTSDVLVTIAAEIIQRKTSEVSTIEGESHEANKTDG